MVASVRIITRELIELVAPKHAKADCDDSNLHNSEAAIEETSVDGAVTGRVWKQSPRCLRCFLLTRLDEELPNNVSLVISASLVLHSPQKEVKSETKWI